MDCGFHLGFGIVAGRGPYRRAAREDVADAADGTQAAWAGVVEIQLAAEVADVRLEQDGTGLVGVAQGIFDPARVWRQTSRPVTWVKFTSRTTRSGWSDCRRASAWRPSPAVATL